jgi:Aerotolerance regulator N-terminal/von Willebrand factor type A domain
MSFLSPALLSLLLPLLTLPLLLHLLNKGFPRPYQFPSVELIKQTLARRSRIHRWRHLILLLLRTLCLLLLLLAFLRPVWKRFGSNPADQANRHVLIMLDHSASMEDKGDGPSSRERAVLEADKLIESLDPDDAINVLLMERSPSLGSVSFSQDHAAARRFLGQLKPGLGRGDVNQANALAGRVLNSALSRPEVYYLSDFQRKNWANADFTALPAAARLFFVDVGPARRDNRAILDARVSQTQVLAGDTVSLEVTLGNYGEQPFDDRLTVVLDQRLSFDQDVSLAPWSEGKITVPVPAGGPGLHLCEIRIPPDALELDDHFYLSLNVREKEEVLIVTDGPTDTKSGAYFLKMALNPFENEGGSLLPRIIPSSELTSSRLAGVRKVFCTQLQRLSEEACAALVRFLFQGGGLIVFLDGSADPENLVAVGKAMGEDTIPMALMKKQAAANVVSGAQQIVRGDFKSRYLKLFRGPTRKDLALLEFYDYYQASATGKGTVLMTYADESPALAVTHHGLGSLLLLNFSANELSSNLARQRLFPAWIQDLVKEISSDEPPPAAYEIGETLHAEVWRNELREDDLRSPKGDPVNVKKNLTGERYHVSFTPEELGIYTLGSPRPLYAFAVNTSPEEADLRPIDKAVLPTEFAGAHEAHFVAGRDEFDELAKGRPLFHWFLLAALVVLLLESGFQLLIRKVAT